MLISYAVQKCYGHQSLILAQNLRGKVTDVCRRDWQTFPIAQQHFDGKSYVPQPDMITVILAKAAY